ncbi:MAG: SdrD B-like domain-containing protein, partial [Dolichospermum sp.]
VSGCYQNGGQSKATVSVEVAWANAPAGQNITVTLSGASGTTPATRTITPGNITVIYQTTPVTKSGAQNIVSPQVVAFEIDANAASGITATAAFAGTPSCNVTSNAVNAPASCTPIACTGANIGGTIFSDFNADGIKSTDETISGISSVNIKVIDKNGVTYTTTSQQFGRWVINTIPAGAYPVRVEFTNIPAGYRNGTLNGTDGRTTVQFINAPDCNVDLGVINDNDYCSNKAPIVIPQFVEGDPLNNSSFANYSSLLMFPYDASGLKDPSKTKVLATAGQIGSTWGVAYNKYTKRIFVSAVLKRHSGLGPEGLGGIYVIDTSITSGSKVVSSWDVATDLGINVGTIPSNSARGLPNSGTTGESVDAAAFTAIGKVGIGD